MYDDARILQYIDRIGYPGTLDYSCSRLDFLASIQKHQLASVPFESVSLHYSKTRLLSLDPDDLFEKIVDNRRGGYCMEVNAFFRQILQSLGFSSISAGARVNGPDGYLGLTHMVNIVTIDDIRYLVDVAFGSNSPIRPIPLKSGIEFDGVAAAKGKLEHKALAQHSDPNQRVWVYSTKEHDNGPWREQYSFLETEFFPADFEVMNLSTMTSPRSLFVRTVVASRVLLDEQHNVIGKVTLNQDHLRIRNGGIDEMKKLETEEERVAALEKYFFISLSPKERDAIKGLPSELKHKEPGADF